MKKLKRMWRRLGYYVRRDKFDRELEAEIRFHLEMKSQDKAARGLGYLEASRAARRQFGNVTAIQESSREMWAFRWIEELVQDLRYCFRMIRKSPVLTAVVVSSLALAIGASTAIFSLVDAVLLKPLPVPNPGQLVLFGWAARKPTPAHDYSGSGREDPKTGDLTFTSFTWTQFQRMREENKTLSDIFAFAPIYTQLNLSLDGHADVASGQFVSGDYYKGLGVSAIVGRTLVDSDDKIGAEPVAVISYKYWNLHCASDPAVLGKSAYVNGSSVTIVGITPPDFDGALDLGDSADVTLPLAAEAAITRRPSRAVDWSWWLRIMGRLKPGTSLEQVRANLEGSFQQCALEGHQAFLAKDPTVPDPVNTPRLTPMPGSQGLDVQRKDHALQLFVLLLVAGLVLVIACANTANLLLARSSARQKEIAVRIALGAGRTRLIRQLLTESVTLALLGAGGGLVLAYWAKGYLMVASPFGGSPVKLDLTLNTRVLLFTAATALFTGIVFGVAPALRATRVETAPVLKDASANQSQGRQKLALGKILIVVQVAISLVLLVGAGLFLRTLRNLERVDCGFDATNLLLFSVNPSLNGYKGESLASVYQQIADRISAIPSVQSTTILQYPFFMGGGWNVTPVRIPGAKIQPPEHAEFYMLPVKENFLDTMRIPVLFGRGLNAADTMNSPMVAVINQAFARLCFPDQDPIGHHCGFGKDKEFSDVEIVGVARDARYDSLRGDPTPVVFFPLAQVVATMDLEGESVTFEVRTAASPMALVPSIRDAVRSIDGNLAIFDVKTQQQQIEGAYANERLFAVFTAALGALALLLAAAGLYGVLSYNVSRRTGEIGIRMALGAAAGRLMAQVMWETMAVVAAGIEIGVALSLAATRVISSTMFGLTFDPAQPSLLFGVSPTDPATIALAALFLFAVALLAAYVPARRASRIDPIRALRYE
jgi:predicted permease